MGNGAYRGRYGSRGGNRFAVSIVWILTIHENYDGVFFLKMKEGESFLSGIEKKNQMGGPCGVERPGQRGGRRPVSLNNPHDHKTAAPKTKGAKKAFFLPLILSKK